MRRPGIRPTVRRSSSSWISGRRYWVVECPGCNRGGVNAGRFLRNWTSAYDFAFAHASSCINLDPTRTEIQPWR